MGDCPKWASRVFRQFPTKIIHLRQMCAAVSDRDFIDRVYSGPSLLYGRTGHSSARSSGPSPSLRSLVWSPQPHWEPWVLFVPWSKPPFHLRACTPLFLTHDGVRMVRRRHEIRHVERKIDKCTSRE